MNSRFRLNKALARAGVCSRRKADQLVFSGRVRVNSQVVRDPGIRVDPGKDTLELDNEVVDLGSSFKEPVYVLLNKPVRVVTTLDDPQGRQTVADILPVKLRRLRLFPVGRLDYFSQGLLIMTNDGALAHELTHPSREHSKVYRVEVRGGLSRKKVQIMEKGMVLKEGEKLAPVQVDVRMRRKNHALLHLTLIQGVNRQIRRMCRDLGLVVLSLTRIQQGAVALGDLKPGEWRYLTPQELQDLRQGADK